MRRIAIFATTLLLATSGCGEKAPTQGGEQSVSKTRPASVTEGQQTSPIAPLAAKHPETKPAITKAPSAGKSNRKAKSTTTPPQESSLPDRIAEIADYFPPLVFGDNERKHRIWACGPSRLLAAMSEPKLCSGERKDDALPGAKQWQGHTIHRVLVMGERPYKRLCVRVQKAPAGDYTATLVELGGRVGSHKTGFKLGPIKRQETIKLSQQQWANLEATLRETKLTELPTLDDIQGFDGTTCIIETVSGDRYHVVRRWGGRVENRAFNRVARDILKLANIDEKHLGVPNYVEVKDNTVVMTRRGNEWAVIHIYDQTKTGARVQYTVRSMQRFGSGRRVVKDFIDLDHGTFQLKWFAAGEGRGRIYYGGNNSGTTPGLGICVTDLEPELLKRLGTVEIRAADLALDYWISPFDQLKRSEADIERRAAIRALGLIGPKAVPTLIKLLGQRDDPLRRYGTFALTRLGPAAVPALIQALAGNSDRARTYAAKTLGIIGPEAKEAVRPLGLVLQGRKDKKDKVGGEAAKGLFKFGSGAKDITHANVVNLLELLDDFGLGHEVEALTGEITTVGFEAARALGKIGPESVPVLVNALNADDRKTRYRAAEALGAIGPAAREAVPALIKALSDEHASVRKYAAKALGEIGPAAREAVPALNEWLSNKDTSVRNHAAVALGKIGPEAKAAVPALVRMFKAASVGAYDGPVVRQLSSNEPHAWSRYHVAQALAMIGPGARLAVPVLVRALKDRNISVRTQVAAALGKIGPVSVEVVPALIQALKDPDSEFIRQDSAKTLGNIGAKAAKLSVPALIQALKDRDFSVRGKASEALGKIGPAAKEAVPALQAQLDHPNAYVRKAAKKAIPKIDPDAKLEPPSSTPPEAVEKEDVF